MRPWFGVNVNVITSVRTTTGLHGVAQPDLERAGQGHATAFRHLPVGVVHVVGVIALLSRQQARKLKQTESSKELLSFGS